MLTTLTAAAVAFAASMPDGPPVTDQQWNAIRSTSDEMWSEMFEGVRTAELEILENEASSLGGDLMKDTQFLKNLRTGFASPGNTFWNERGGTVNGDITTIPFAFDSTYTSDARAWILRAMAHLEDRVGCIRFKQRTSEYRYIRFVTHNSSGCWAYFGPQYKAVPTTVQLSPGCLPTRTILHEIIHTLGFDHTHERPDADQWITTHWDNVNPGSERNFGACSDCQKPENPYDCMNIMHYSSDEMGKKVNGIRQTTLSSKRPSECQMMTLNERFDHFGRSYRDHLPLREQISENDVLGIQEVYCPNWRPDPSATSTTTMPVYTSPSTSTTTTASTSTTTTAPSSTTTTSTAPTSTTTTTSTTSFTTTTTSKKPSGLNCHSLAWHEDFECIKCLPPALGGQNYPWWPCNQDGLCSEDCFVH